MDMYIDLEQIRQEYKPEFIRVLFIGESPPNSGTFFYLDDPYRTFLLRYTRDAFEDVYHQKWQEPGSFLLFFRSRGCYLDDLCHKPINHLEKKSRLIKRKGAVKSLSERIKDMKPSSIIIVMKGIEKYVTEAIGDTSVPRYSLSFPSHGHQIKYKEGLVKIFRKLINQGFI
jgi:hypothetical protein